MKTLESYFPSRKRLRTLNGERNINNKTTIGQSSNSFCLNKSPMENNVTAEPPKLDSLPVEMLFLICSFSDFEDLGILAQSNRILRDSILRYLHSSNLHRRLERAVSNSRLGGESCENVFRAIGYTFKRATCLLPTSKRVKLAEIFYSQNGPEDLVISSSICDAWGVWISAVVSGWEYDECERVFMSVCQFGSLQVNSLLNKFLLHVPGTYPEVEHRLRMFFRGLFLNSHYNATTIDNSCEFGFWLDVILRRHSLYFQAKIIFLIFGPMDNGVIQWKVMCDRDVRNTSLYREIGRALRSLSMIASDSKRCRSQASVASLIEEVTSLPDNWTIQNYAYLLDNCGEELLSMSLSSRLINGHTSEVCEVFCCLALISIRTGSSMIKRVRLFLKLVHTMKNQDKQLALIFQLAKTHHSRMGRTFATNTVWEEELTANERFYGEVLRLALRESSDAIES